MCGRDIPGCVGDVPFIIGTSRLKWGPPHDEWRYPSEIWDRDIPSVLWGHPSAFDQCGDIPDPSMVGHPWAQGTSPLDHGGHPN